MIPAADRRRWMPIVQRHPLLAWPGAEVDISRCGGCYQTAARPGSSELAVRSPSLVKKRAEFLAAADAELAEDGREVVFDRPNGDHQLLGDRAGRQPS